MVRGFAWRLCQNSFPVLGPNFPLSVKRNLLYKVIYSWRGFHGLHQNFASIQACRRSNQRTCMCLVPCSKATCLYVYHIYTTPPSIYRQSRISSQTSIYRHNRIYARTFIFRRQTTIGWRWRIPYGVETMPPCPSRRAERKTKKRTPTEIMPRETSSQNATLGATENVTTPKARTHMSKHKNTEEHR
jgi:hypothetical protein